MSPNKPENDVIIAKLETDDSVDAANVLAAKAHLAPEGEESHRLSRLASVARTKAWRELFPNAPTQKTQEVA